MFMRMFLFLLTNVAVVVTISIILSVLGVRPGDGLGSMAIFCLIWGMGGAFISLAISRWMAKRAMGVQLVDGNTPMQTGCTGRWSGWPSRPSCRCPRSGSTNHPR